MDIAVSRFLDCSRRYCALIDSVGSLGRGEFLWAAGEQLSALYASAIELPGVALVYERVSALVTRSSGDLDQRLGEFLGDLDAYHRVFDPYEPEDPRTLSPVRLLTTSPTSTTTSHGAQDSSDQPTANELWNCRVHATGALYAIPG